MALQGNLVTNDGVTHTAAYAKVVQVNANWLDKQAHVVLNIYHDAAARADLRVPVQQVGYSFGPTAMAEVKNAEEVVIAEAVPTFDEVFGIESLEANNPVAKTYEFVATRLAFEGWTQV